MKLKSYHAETVEAAVRLAGIELGGNAVFCSAGCAPGLGRGQPTARTAGMR